MTNILNIYSLITNNLYVFFEEMSVQIICPFLIGCLFFLLNHKISLYNLNMSFIRNVICKHFLTVGGLSFYFFGGVF